MRKGEMERSDASSKLRIVQARYHVIYAIGKGNSARGLMRRRVCLFVDRNLFYVGGIIVRATLRLNDRRL